MPHHQTSCTLPATSVTSGAAILLPTLVSHPRTLLPSRNTYKASRPEGTDVHARPSKQNHASGICLGVADDLD